MKIGLVLPDLPQYSETFFNYKIKGLIANGHEVVVFTTRNENPVSVLPYKVRFAPPVRKGNPVLQGFQTAVTLLKVLITSYSSSARLFGFERADGKSIAGALKSLYLNSHIISERVDRLHFGFATSALQRENAARAVGARMSVSFRGFDINVYPLKHQGCYELLWKRTDKVHTISDYLRTKAVKLGLPESKPFAKITPAIDISKFSLKSDSGRFHDPVRILTVGRLNWIKDYETAISALGILKTKGVNFTYEIIGEGKEMERLKFAAYQTGIWDSVKFSGKVSHEEIAKRMQESDIYLQTSMQEGFCVSVLEAQAAGLICIVSNADGLKENVVDNVTGFLAERRNPGDFADRISDVISMSESERQQIAQAARMRVEEEFSIERQNQLFNEFFLN